MNSKDIMIKKDKIFYSSKIEYIERIIEEFKSYLKQKEFFEGTSHYQAFEMLYIIDEKRHIDIAYDCLMSLPKLDNYRKFYNECINKRLKNDGKKKSELILFIK